MNRNQLVEMLRRTQGQRTAKQFAEELGISPQYLSDVYSGRKEPGNGILSKLGIKRRMVYETA